MTYCLPQGSDGGVVMGSSDVGSVMGGTGGGAVMVNGTAGAAIVIVYVKPAGSRLTLSVTLMVKVAAPATVGVPLKTPPALRMRPEGNGPDAGSRVQVKGGVPPCCRRVVETNGTWTTPLGRDWVVIVMLRGSRMFSVMVRDADATPELSVATKAGVPAPAADGVPVRTPAALRINPAGRPVQDHL